MDNCVFENGNECNALRVKECAGCRFRKTKEELIESREKAAERIDTLPDARFYHIVRKYYPQRRRVEK